MADATAIVVDWYGPFFSLREAEKEADEARVGEALYLAYSRSGSAYIGITGGIGARFNNHHLSLNRVMADKGEIWIGLVASQSIPGRRPQGSYTAHTLPLRLAEQILIYSIQPSENIHHKSKPPSAPGILINRWFDAHNPWPRKDRGHPEWPDVIEYELELDLIQKAWFGGRHQVLNRDQVAALSRKNSN